MQFSKVFLSETTRLSANIFRIWHHLEVLYQSYSNYAPRIKIKPRPGGCNFTLIYKMKSSNDFFSLTANGNLTKGLVPGWPPIKIVQMFLIGYISRSWSPKIGSQNAFFKTYFCLKLQDLFGL